MQNLLGKSYEKILLPIATNCRGDYKLGLSNLALDAFVAEIERLQWVDVHLPGRGRRPNTPKLRLWIKVGA